MSKRKTKSASARRRKPASALSKVALLAEVVMELENRLEAIEHEVWLSPHHRREEDRADVTPSEVDRG